jgi:hypothetical protein
MITYHPHSKIIYNLKIMVLKFFRNSKYNFQNFKFQESFAICKWVIMRMTYEKNCGLLYKKLKLKVIHIF